MPRSPLQTFLGLLASAALGGQLTAQSNPLDRYLQQGLERNPTLRQQALAVRQSEAVLQEARGGFLPSATLSARYTDVRGQVVNLGELINPAFSALN